MPKIKVEIGGKPTDVDLTLDELITLIERNRTKQPITRTKRPTTPNSEKIKEFILTKPSPRYKHTMNDIMLHFLKRTIIAKEDKNTYNALYTNSVRARTKIAKKLNGKWYHRKVGDPFKGGYKEYLFKKNK